jgi:hypothetical protein
MGGLSLRNIITCDDEKEDGSTSFIRVKKSRVDWFENDFFWDSPWWLYSLMALGCK